MSYTEFAYGTFETSDLLYEPEDTDDFYALEDLHGCHFVKVVGQLYRFDVTESDSVGRGLSLALPPTEKNSFFAIWYNGGAGIHEVVERIIKQHIGEAGK